MTRKFSINTRVRCPKCGSIRPVISKHRPLRLDCNCGTVMILDK
jgi:ribosomal protein S27E